MTPLEQVKERIDRMRITRPDDNGLCKLLDFVEGLVKEENNINSKSKLNNFNEVEGLVEELRSHIKKETNGGDMPSWMAQDFENIISRYENTEAK